ncbi:ABC transporter ATP-binding protein [Tepidibacillus marianensis]|uniref:ABC transporter ATP-binding protein n=1 Tax=Tepidibacillus marianensis TaxID=3131995 RepID=UPI0030CC9E01
MDSILQVKNLKKVYQQKVAVEDISFQIHTGEAYGLLGPNGAGKSTTIHMIAGIEEVNNGEVFIQNNSIQKERKKAQSFIGVVPQEIALYPSMNAEANLRFFGKLYGIKGHQLDQAVEENLKLVGLYDRRKEAVEKYSGGMKRRINIAAALLHQPKLLIMDEPTVGIDPQSRSHILETVKKLKEEKGISILYTSHYMEEVEVICDRVGIIDHGKLIAEGNLTDLKKDYGDRSQLLIQLKNTKKLQSNLSNLREKIGFPIEESEKGLRIITYSPHEALPLVMNELGKVGCEIRSIDIMESNLETIFLTLTGRTLRDE